MDGAAEAGLQRATHTLQQERRLGWGVSAAPALPLTAWEVMGGCGTPKLGTTQGGLLPSDLRFYQGRRAGGRG